MAIWIMAIPMGQHSEISKPYTSAYLEASQAMTDTTERKLAEKIAKNERKKALEAESGVYEFHKHLDMCKQCRENPFGLCWKGQRLLLRATIMPVMNRAQSSKEGKLP